MSGVSRKQFLMAERAATVALLERLDEGHFIERIGLESRLEALDEELRELADVPEPVRATVYFGGQPVVEQQGIEANFAANAVSKFQALIERVGSARRHGPLGRGGMVPEGRDFRLHITDIARGSFGFEFTQFENEAVNHQDVKAAVDEATGLLDGLKRDEDAFAEAMVEIDHRVFTSLRDFVKVLSNSEATLRVVSGERELGFSVEDIHRAYSRMEATEPDIKEIELRVTFLGFLAGSRQFEFQGQDGNIYKGRLSNQVSDEELRDLVLRPCIAHLRITTVERPGRIPKKSYVLIAIRSLDTAGTLDH